jgi:hypothetical protein
VLKANKKVGGCLDIIFGFGGVTNNAETDFEYCIEANVSVNTKPYMKQFNPNPHCFIAITKAAARG